jgi:dopamine beta-monooxygenase
MFFFDHESARPPCRFDPPRELRPGDQIITRCIFNSMSKEKRTYYGEGTNDEMCFGFMK